MSKGQLGDYVFKGAVTLLAGGSVLAGISVAISMADRFAFHRQVSSPSWMLPACMLQVLASTHAPMHLDFANGWLPAE